MDLISRAAAIDVMCELMCHWFGGDPKDEIREIKRELEKLPSAQPDKSYSDGFADGYKRGLIDAQPERKSPCANCQEFDCSGCGARMEVSE